MDVVLIAEDEKSLSQVLKLNMEMEGFDVFVAENGRQALEIFDEKKASIDLVLLDVMMPIVNGFEVCRIMKEQEPTIPIIFLTAKGESEDRIRGLKTGADDYLVKPFNLEELLLRIKNVLKRTKATNSRDEVLLKFGNNEVDFSTFQCRGFDGETHTLTKRECQLLKLLSEKKEQVVSRDEILEKLWDLHENPSARTIDNMILNFRKYFEENQREPRHFQSVRGVGYKFSA